MLGVRRAGGWVGWEEKDGEPGTGAEVQRDDISLSWDGSEQMESRKGPPRRTLGAGVGAVPAVFYVNGAP